MFTVGGDEINARSHSITKDVKSCTPVISTKRGVDDTSFCCVIRALGPSLASQASRFCCVTGWQGDDSDHFGLHVACLLSLQET